MKLRFVKILSLASLLFGWAEAEKSTWGLDIGSSFHSESYVLSLGLNQRLGETDFELFEVVGFPFHRDKVLRLREGEIFQMNLYNLQLGLGARYVYPITEVFQLEAGLGLGYFPGNYSGTSMEIETKIAPSAELGLKIGFNDIFGIRTGYRYAEYYPQSAHYFNIDLSFDF